MLDIYKEVGIPMGRFAKKRFFITLGISIVIWLLSGLVQAIVGFSNYFTVFHQCSLTGYPIAVCLSSNNQIKVITISFVNIALWFCMIHFVGNLVKKRNT